MQNRARGMFGRFISYGCKRGGKCKLELYDWQPNAISKEVYCELCTTKKKNKETQTMQSFICWMIYSNNLLY